MKTEWLKIFLIVLLEGEYDFKVWYGVAKEQSGIWWEKWYRIAKETFDLVIIPGVMCLYGGWSIDMLTAFYIVKWVGWCDAVYIANAKLFTLGKKYIDGLIWWMWWTPLGAKRSQIVRSHELSTFEAYEYFHLWGDTYFLKGKITFTEFQVQLGAGLAVSYALYHFGAASWIVRKLILGMF